MSVYFLFAAASCLLLYVVPFFWPLIVVAQVGTLLTLYHKKLGCYLAFGLLLGYCAYDAQHLMRYQFIFFFIGSLAVSWWIEYLRKTERQKSPKEGEKETDYRLLEYAHETLQKQYADIEKELHQAQRDLFSMETRVQTLEKERDEVRVRESLDFIYLQHLCQRQCLRMSAYEKENQTLEEIVSLFLPASKNRASILPEMQARYETIDLLEYLQKRSIHE